MIRDISGQGMGPSGRHPALAKENADRARPEAAPAPLRPLEMVSEAVARVQAIVRAQQASLTDQ